MMTRMLGCLALPPAVLPPPLLLLLLLAGCAVAQLVSMPTASAMPPASPAFFNSRAGRLKSSTHSHVEVVGFVFIFSCPLSCWLVYLLKKRTSPVERSYMPPTSPIWP